MSTSAERSTGAALKGPGSGEVAAFRNVSKRFGPVLAVNDISLTLHPGETVAFLGPNGAGKSTSIDMLLGLREPTSGSVTLFGGTPRQAVLDGRVGVMLQSGGLMPDVKVRELVRFACDVHPRGYAVDDVLRTAGIADIGDRMVDKLSGGQEQRVRFALATAGDSDLIVLDEPTTGMDVSARQAFWAVMRAQSDAGRTVLFATHYLEEADSIADRVLVVHKGRLIADGTAAEIKARAGLRKISFDLLPEDGPDPRLLSGLPGVTSLDVSGHTVRINSDDADAVVAAIYRAGFYPRGLEVVGVGLEQAFLTITGEQDAADESASQPAPRTAPLEKESAR